MSQQLPYGQQPRFTPSENYSLPPQGPGGPGFYPPQPPPKKKRHWVRNTFLGIAGLIVLIVIIAVATGGGGSNAPAPSSAGATSAAAAAAPAAPAAVAKVGSAVKDGKFQFTITSISQAKSVGDTADGLGDTAQGEYTILHVTVTNIGSQAQTLDDSSQYVYDASGRKYDASTSADMDVNTPSSGSDSVFLNNINPGNTVKGELAFDMPTGAKAVKAELHDSPFSGGVTVSLP